MQQSKAQACPLVNYTITDTVMKHKFTLALAGLFLIVACEKRTEILEIPTEKKYSWVEKKRFTGTEKIFLSSGKSANSIYLQQPYSFTALSNQNATTSITIFAAALPTDIEIRMPINGDFCAFPISDTTLRVINNAQPLVSPSGGYFNLKKIDPTLTSIQKYYYTLFKSMAINKNGALLLAYFNNRPVPALTFMLLKIKTSPSYPYVYTLFTKKIAIPKTGVDAYVRHIAAVNDYFLLDLSSNGIYKIKEDGSFGRVYGPATIDAFYAWQGKIYAHGEGDRLLISTNEGDSWQEFSGLNTSMTFSNYYVINDSLIGVYRDNLFTLKWNASNYKQRFLKNDGVEGTRINGVEVLGDTVFLATTSGLFARPLKAFFDSK